MIGLDLLKGFYHACLIIDLAVTRKGVCFLFFDRKKSQSDDRMVPGARQ